MRLLTVFATTPSALLPMSSVPVTSVPMKLLYRWLPPPQVPDIEMPAPPLPEIRFRCQPSSPPTWLPPEFWKAMPARPFPRSRRPVRSVPMKLPSNRWNPAAESQS